MRIGASLRLVLLALASSCAAPAPVPPRDPFERLRQVVIERLGIELPGPPAWVLQSVTTTAWVPEEEFDALDDGHKSDSARRWMPVMRCKDAAVTLDGELFTMSSPPDEGPLVGVRDYVSTSWHRPAGCDFDYIGLGVDARIAFVELLARERVSDRAALASVCEAESMRGRRDAGRWRTVRAYADWRRELFGAVEALGLADGKAWVNERERLAELEAFEQRVAVGGAEAELIERIWCIESGGKLCELAKQLRTRDRAQLRVLLDYWDSELPGCSRSFDLINDRYLGQAALGQAVRFVVAQMLGVEEASKEQLREYVSAPK